ncbi:Cell division protein SepF [uncultured archaeon]|nr:Cell division protein SepF [uncultured archaeon]
MNFFKRLKKSEGEEADSPDFIQIDSGSEKSDSKVQVKTFVLKTYEDINPILNALREGYSIVVIDIKSLKAKDVIELKRVVSKVKKTVEAIEGSIAGFGDNCIIATPSFAKIQKGVADVAPAAPRDDIEKFGY